MSVRIHKLFRFSGILRSVCDLQEFSQIKQVKNSFSQETFQTNGIIQPILNESSYAHRILEKNPLYARMIVPRISTAKLELNFSDLLSRECWADLTVSEFVQKFEYISKSSNLPISHDSCAELRSALIKSSEEMTDDQLASLLLSLSYWPFSASPNETGFHDVWKALDLVCLSRWRKWDLEKIFYFLELWHNLFMSRQSDFVFKVVGKLLNRPSRLQKEQVVLLLYHLSVLRTVTKSMPMYLLESRLAEIAEQLTLDELSVAVMGFFKGDKCIYDVTLMNMIIDKLIQGIKTVDDIPFTAIIKVLRKCLPPSLFPRAEEVANAIVPEVRRLSLSAVSHAALFATRPQLLHPPLLASASQKLLENISQARIKELEKVTFALTQMVFDPQTDLCVFNEILKELDKPGRSDEIAAYPKSFVALIHYLILKGIYPDKWISKILDMDFITKTYGPRKFCFGRELLFMDCCVQLEYPSYSGSRLMPDLRTYLSKKYCEVLPNPARRMSRHQKWHFEVFQTAQLLFGEENVCQKYLLPHHPKADIIVHLDDDYKPLRLSEEIINGECFERFLEAPGSNYFVIIPASINMFIWNSELLNGENQAKLRQLKMIGYTPVVVGYQNWPHCKTFEKVDFLRNLISSANNNIKLCSTSGATN